jgi:hypothetical protein
MARRPLPQALKRRKRGGAVKTGHKSGLGGGFRLQTGQLRADPVPSGAVTAR